MIKSSIYAVTALSILLFITPFLPTDPLLIQLRDIEVEGSQMSLTRTVTIPVDAYMTYEIDNGKAYPQCNRDAGFIHYESRGVEPVVFDLICDPPPGELIMRYCVQAVWWFGIRLKTSCLEEDFRSGPLPEEIIQEQVDKLQLEIQQLRDSGK